MLLALFVPKVSGPATTEVAIPGHLVINILAAQASSRLSLLTCAECVGVSKEELMIMHSTLYAFRSSAAVIRFGLGADDSKLLRRLLLIWFDATYEQ